MSPEGRNGVNSPSWIIKEENKMKVLKDYNNEKLRGDCISILQEGNSLDDAIDAIDKKFQVLGIRRISISCQLVAENPRVWLVQCNCGRA